MWSAAFPHSLSFFTTWNVRVNVVVSLLSPSVFWQNLVMFWSDFQLFWKTWLQPVTHFTSQSHPKFVLSHSHPHGQWKQPRCNLPHSLQVVVTAWEIQVVIMIKCFYCYLLYWHTVVGWLNFFASVARTSEVRSRFCLPNISNWRHPIAHIYSAFL